MSSVGIYNEFHNLIYSVKSKLNGSGLSAIIDFTSEQISNTMTQNQHEKKLSQRNDFTSKLLQMYEADPVAFPLAKVYATALTNIGAGSDTTSVSLSGIMYGLMKHPSCYGKVVQTQSFTSKVPCEASHADSVSSCVLSSTPRLRLALSRVLRSTAKLRLCHTFRHVSRRASECTLQQACQCSVLSLPRARLLPGQVSPLA